MGEKCPGYKPVKINDLLPNTCWLDLKNNKPTATFERSKFNWFVLTPKIWLRGDDYTRFGQFIGHQWLQHVPYNGTAMALFRRFFLNLYNLATRRSDKLKDTEFVTKDGVLHSWQDLITRETRRRERARETRRRERVKRKQNRV